jgi:hypothetical protein
MLRSSNRIVKAVALLFLAMAAARSVYAQNFTANDLQTPISPAFTLTGDSPTAIERPETPKALFATVLGALSGGGTAQGLALEFAPYWLKDHPELTLEKYYSPALWQRIAQSASLSVLLKPSDDGSSIAALGARTILAMGIDKDELTRLQSMHDFDATWLSVLKGLTKGIADKADGADFNTVLASSMEAYELVESEASAEVKESISRLREKVDAILALLASDSAVRTVKIVMAITEESDAFEKRSNERIISWRESRKIKSGPSLELAGACALASKTGDYSDASLDKAGAWITGLLAHETIDALLCLRGTYDHSAGDAIYLDGGARLIFSQEGLSISGEALARYDFSTFRYRLGINGRKTLTPGLALDLALNKGYGDETDPTGGKLSFSVTTILSSGKSK